MKNDPPDVEKPKSEKAIRDTSSCSKQQKWSGKNVSEGYMAKARTSIGPQDPHNPEQCAASTKSHSDSKGKPIPRPIVGSEA